MATQAIPYFLFIIGGVNKKGRLFSAIISFSSGYILWKFGLPREAPTQEPESSRVPCMLVFLVYISDDNPVY